MIGEWLGWTDGNRADAEQFRDEMAALHNCGVVIRQHDSGGWDAFAVVEAAS